MSGGSSVNTEELESALGRAELRVRKIQTKLHRWAREEPHRRFDDLFNLVADPAFLLVAWDRVRGNKGARTAGVDGQTADYVQAVRGVEGFLGELRSGLKDRSFCPLPVRERMIPKANGKLRRLGIATIADRVVQAALKLVLEPIWEADFLRAATGSVPDAGRMMRSLRRSCSSPTPTSGWSKVTSRRASTKSRTRLLWVECDSGSETNVSWPW